VNQTKSNHQNFPLKAVGRSILPLVTLHLPVPLNTKNEKTKPSLFSQIFNTNRSITITNKTQTLKTPSQKRSQEPPKGNIQFATFNRRGGGTGIQRMIKPQGPLLLEFEVSLDFGRWSVGASPSIRGFNSVLSVSSCSMGLTRIDAN
jgi:hypothetical protein